MFKKPLALWRQMIVATLFIALLSLSVTAQKPKPKPCPTLQFEAPVYEVKKGELLKMAIRVTGGDPDVDYTYNWMVSDGAIASGQGTDRIDIDTAAAQGANITATVEIGGASPECSMAKSLTTAVLSNPAALKVYEGAYL